MTYILFGVHVVFLWFASSHAADENVELVQMHVSTHLHADADVFAGEVAANNATPTVVSQQPLAYTVEVTASSNGNCPVGTYTPHSGPGGGSGGTFHWKHSSGKFLAWWNPHNSWWFSGNVQQSGQTAGTVAPDPSAWTACAFQYKSYGVSSSVVSQSPLSYNAVVTDSSNGNCPVGTYTPDSGPGGGSGGTFHWKHSSGKYLAWWNPHNSWWFSGSVQQSGQTAGTVAPDPSAWTACTFHYEGEAPCDDGQWRNGVACQSCESCSSGSYRVGCSNNDAGTCKSCSKVCNGGYYLAKCANQNPGTCEKCTVCTDKEYLIGCSGTSAGTCKAKMSCTDVAQGFVNVGDPITKETNAYAKSCPVNAPVVVTSAVCANDKCLVQPDRNNCCRESTCTCLHGRATTNNGVDGTFCQADGTEDCSQCDDGYQLSSKAALGLQTCKPNVCVCDKGTPTVATGSGGTFCATDGQHDCSKCNVGYHLSADAGPGSQTCKANICTCSSGTPSVATGSGGTLCKTDSTEDCDSCHAGYTLSAAADENLQVCQANTCNTHNLPSSNTKYDVSGCQNGATTGQKCHVGCADGYSGGDAVWMCLASGALNGSNPTCEPQKCNTEVGGQMFTSHVTTNNCTDAKTNDMCVATCNNGYSGATQTYTCEASGFTGETMDCKADPCDASHTVSNGGVGDCTDSLASGRQCTITCDEGYTRTGITSCVAGKLTSVASCEEDPCDASEPPAHGTAGSCTAKLASGGTCMPECDVGYKVSGPSRCNQGKLTPAACEADLQCHLVYEQNCATQYGYWSDAEKHLNYPGCEAFCNEVYVAHGTIKGCELAMVSSAERATKGTWCFAHEEPCAAGKADNMAAAECVPRKN